MCQFHVFHSHSCANSFETCCWRHIQNEHIVLDKNNHVSRVSAFDMQSFFHLQLNKGLGDSQNHGVLFLTCILYRVPILLETGVYSIFTLPFILNLVFSFVYSCIKRCENIHFPLQLDNWYVNSCISENLLMDSFHTSSPEHISDFTH